MTSESRRQIWIMAFPAEPAGVGGRKCENLVAETQKTVKMKNWMKSAGGGLRCSTARTGWRADMWEEMCSRLPKKLQHYCRLCQAFHWTTEGKISNKRNIKKGGGHFLSVGWKLMSSYFWLNPPKRFVLQQAWRRRYFYFIFFTWNDFCLFRC